MRPWGVTSFPVATGVGLDNISPRALCRLSSDSICCLCKILCASELLGSWAQCVSIVLIVLLPKPDGGRRPIGLFPTLIRVWMRARVHIAREWEAANSRPCLYGGPSMGAQRAAWQAAFAAESAARSGNYFAQSLLDLVKAFEMIPHHLIANAARKHNFSPWLLRLSLAAYRLPRTIGVDGVYSRTIVASRGITAGSGFATTELRVLLIDIIDDTYRLYPAIQLAVYVDDITPYTHGPDPAWVVTQVAGVTDHLVHVLEDDYDLEVSSKKSCTIASSPKLAQHVAHFARSRKIVAKRASKLLGAPIGGGRRRSVRHLTKRLQDARVKTHRIHSLRRAGVRTKLVVRAAVTPAITYAIECVGASNTHLHNMRVAVAQAAAADACGKNPDLVLWTADADVGTMDPAFDAHVLPLKFWPYAVWQQWRPPGVLDAAICNVSAKLDASKSTWAVTTGPVAVLLNSMWRIGWELHSFATLTDDRGQAFDLRLDPPAVIERAARESVRRWRLARIANSFTCLREFCYSRRNSQGEVTHLLCRDVVDLSHVLRPVLAGKARSCRDAPRWSAKHSSMLLSAISGGQWPQARLASTRSFTDDDRCQLCLQEQGTLEHRYHCTVTRPPDGWVKPHSDSQQLIDSLPAEQRHLLRTRGLLFARAASSLLSQEANLVWLLEPPEIMPDDVRFYVDGSAMDPTLKFFTSVGFAIVVVAFDGALLGVALGTPPSWIRDSAGAEAWAVYTVLAMSVAFPNIVTDCLGIINGLAEGRTKAAAPCRSLARVWSMIYNTLDAEVIDSALQARVTWMPSHGSRLTIGSRDKSDGQAVTTIDWRANRLADAVAKAAAVENRFAASSRILLQRTITAYERALVELAVVTLAANTHEVVVPDPNGGFIRKCQRDSAPAPRARRIRRCWHTFADDAILPELAHPSIGSMVQGKSLKRHCPTEHRAAKRRRMDNDNATIADARLLLHWREERSKRAFQPANSTPAAERIAAVRARVCGTVSSP